MEAIKQSEKKLTISCYSINTKKPYLSHIKGFLDFCGNKPEQDKIEDYLYELRAKRNYEPSSLNTAKYALIYFFTKVLKQNLIVRLDQIRREIKNPEYFTQEQITQIISAVFNIKHKVLIEIAYGSGLRANEAISLKWNDINFEDKVINLRKGKGSKDRITILPEQTIEHLREWQKKQEEYYKSDWIFSSQARDYHISHRTFQLIIKKACKKAGLNVRAFPHKLRHSFATHMMNNGTDTRIIQKVLGHNSIKSTQRYTHVSNRDIRNLISPLDVISKGKYNEVLR